MVDSGNESEVEWVTEEAERERLLGDSSKGPHTGPPSVCQSDWVFRPDSVSPTPHHHVTYNAVLKSQNGVAIMGSPRTVDSQEHDFQPTRSPSPFASNNSSPSGVIGRSREDGGMIVGAGNVLGAKMKPHVLLHVSPSADVELMQKRVSDLRNALEASMNRVAHSEQRGTSLQNQLSEEKISSERHRLKVIELQHNIALLGGNLQGRLNFAQGHVIQELQRQLQEKSQASEQLMRSMDLCRSENDNLRARIIHEAQSAEKERDRLIQEAAQCRLLSTSRNRRVAQLENDVKCKEGKILELQSALEVKEGQMAEEVVKWDIERKENEKLIRELRQEVRCLEAGLREKKRELEDANGQIRTLELELDDAEMQADMQDTKIADLETSDAQKITQRYQRELEAINQKAQEREKQLLREIGILQDKQRELEKSNMLQQRSQQQQQPGLPHNAVLQKEIEKLRGELDEQTARADNFEKLFRLKEKGKDQNTRGSVSEERKRWNEALGLSSSSDSSINEHGAKRGSCTSNTSSVSVQTHGKVPGREALVEAREELRNFVSINKKLADENQNYKRRNHELREETRRFKKLVQDAGKDKEASLERCNMAWQNVADEMEEKVSSMADELTELKREKYLLQARMELASKVEPVGQNLHQEATELRKQLAEKEQCIEELEKKLQAQHELIEKVKLDAEEDAAVSIMDARSRMSDEFQNWKIEFQAERSVELQHIKCQIEQEYNQKIGDMDAASKSRLDEKLREIENQRRMLQRDSGTQTEGKGAEVDMVSACVQTVQLDVQQVGVQISMDDLEVDGVEPEGSVEAGVQADLCDVREGDGASESTAQCTGASQEGSMAVRCDRYTDSPPVSESSLVNTADDEEDGRCLMGSPDKNRSSCGDAPQDLAHVEDSQGSCCNGGGKSDGTDMDVPEHRIRTKIDKNKCSCRNSDEVDDESPTWERREEHGSDSHGRIPARVGNGFSNYDWERRSIHSFIRNRETMATANELPPIRLGPPSKPSLWDSTTGLCHRVSMNDAVGASTTEPMPLQDYTSRTVNANHGSPTSPGPLPSVQESRFTGWNQEIECREHLTFPSDIRNWGSYVGNDGSLHDLSPMCWPKDRRGRQRLFEREEDHAAAEPSSRFSNPLSNVGNHNHTKTDDIGWRDSGWTRRENEQCKEDDLCYRNGAQNGERKHRQRSFWDQVDEKLASPYTPRRSSRTGRSRQREKAKEETFRQPVFEPVSPRSDLASSGSAGSTQSTPRARKGGCSPSLPADIQRTSDPVESMTAPFVAAKYTSNCDYYRSPPVEDSSYHTRCKPPHRLPALDPVFEASSRSRHNVDRGSPSTAEHRNAWRGPDFHDTNARRGRTVWEAHQDELEEMVTATKYQYERSLQQEEKCREYSKRIAEDDDRLCKMRLHTQQRKEKLWDAQLQSTRNRTFVHTEKFHPDNVHENPLARSSFTSSISFMTKRRRSGYFGERLGRLG